MVTFTVRIAARVKDSSRETRRRVTGPCSKLRFKSVVKRLSGTRRLRRGRWRRKVLDDSGSSHFCSSAVLIVSHCEVL